MESDQPGHALQLTPSARSIAIGLRLEVIHVWAPRPAAEVAQLRIRSFTSGIRRAVADKNWYAALPLALALPDICAWIQWENGAGPNHARYSRWFEENLGHLYRRPMGKETMTFMSGIECFLLRSSFLHAGGEDIKAGKHVDASMRFVFLRPDDGWTQHHRIRTGDRLGLQVDLFCTEMCDAVDAWATPNLLQDAEVQQRALDLLAVRAMHEAFPSGAPMPPTEHAFHIVSTS